MTFKLGGGTNENKGRTFVDCSRTAMMGSSRRCYLGLAHWVVWDIRTGKIDEV